MRVSIGLGSQLALGVDELVGCALPAARFGFAGIWTPKRTVPDAFHLCARWAALTAGEGTRVGIAVVPAPQMWHPASLAAQAATVAEFSGGRFVLGLGTGGYGTEFWREAGYPDRPIAVMGDFVDATRAVLSGADAHVGRTFSVHHAALERAAPKVPIHLGALGPGMIRLAARVADGVILNGATREGIATSRGWLDDELAKVGRERGDVVVSMYLRCCVDEDVDAARRVVAAGVLKRIAPSTRRSGATTPYGYRGQFVRLGYEREIASLERALAAGRPATELLDDVPVELCRASAYFGPADGAAERVAELAQGLDEVILRIVAVRPGVGSVHAAMEALAPGRVLAAMRRDAAPDAR